MLTWENEKNEQFWGKEPKIYPYGLWILGQVGLRRLGVVYLYSLKVIQYIDDIFEKITNQELKNKQLVKGVSKVESNLIHQVKANFPWK